MASWSLQVSEDKVVVFGSPTMEQFSSIMGSFVNPSWRIDIPESDKLNATLVFRKPDPDEIRKPLYTEALCE